MDNLIVGIALAVIAFGFFYYFFLIEELRFQIRILKDKQELTTFSVEALNAKVDKLKATNSLRL